jgi:hypothetical protein
MSLLVLPAGPYEPSGDGALVGAWYIPDSTNVIINYSIIDVARPLLTFYLYLVFISYLWTCDLYGPVCNAFDAGKSITRASRRGLGPGNRDFFGPCEMVSSHLGPKKSRFPGPNPLPLAHGRTG